MTRPLTPSIALCAASLLAACAPSGVARHSFSNASPLAPISLSPSTEVFVDAQLSSEGCGASTAANVGGFARMKVRDAQSGGELEYEFSIDNPDRLRLTEAVVVLSRLPSPRGDRNATLVLWTGEPSGKQRVRMRGIVALPHGIATAHVAAALKERRGALRLRIADDTGALAGCGDLRN